jgi:pimeloyl-ACP methyl ester carboxylesterase
MNIDTPELVAGTPTGRFVELNGVRIHYLDWPGVRETHAPALLIHGLSAHAHTWDPIAHALSADRRVVALDLRGHGDSAWAQDGYDVEKFVADIVGLLNHLELDAVDYIGHSFGAQIGFAFAGAHPGRVRRIVFNDMGPEMATAAVGATRSAVGPADVKGFASEAAAREHFRAQYPEWESIFIDLHARFHVRRNWAGKYVFKSDPDLFWILGSAGKRSVPYVWKMAAQIRAPALLLRGTRSTVLSDELVRKVADTVPGIRIRNVDAGHYFPRENAAQFVRAVREFLDPPALPRS